MRDLIDELNKASDAYYNSDTPIMSDEEFDIKLEKLNQLEKESGIIYSDSPTQRVGAFPILDGLNKISITPKPMLSLDKCHTAQEVENFAQDQDVFASLKCDGVSVRLKYQDGQFISANTRGNGEIGTDITEHVRHFKNVPLTIGISGNFIVDGEAIIKNQDFQAININNEFKNPRNTVAGSLNLLDMNVVHQRRISFIAWEIITPMFDSKVDCLSYITKYFEVVPYCSPHLKHESVEEVNETIIKWGNELGIPYDGVVWKFNNIKYAESLGATSHHFKDGIAWKPEVEIAESHLRYVNWQMGRTGVLTPVAVFDPVELDGSIVERASLHNYSIMRKVLGPCAYDGEGLKIIKANMIIPQIIEAYPHYNYGEVVARGGVSAHDELEYCPVCRGEVALQKSADGVLNYWCLNPGCEGKLINKLDHFCGKKGMDIKGLSKATLEKLVDWGWVESIIDLYALSSHRNEWIQKNGFGEKSVDNILSAIEQSKDNVILSSFLSAIGIPLVGQNIAKEICKNADTYKAFKELITNKFDFAKWDTFGPSIRDSLLSFNYEEADRLAKLMNFVLNENSIENNLEGLIFVITGSLTTYKNRNELKTLIENKGGKVVSAISAKTNYLINNDINSTSSKNISAKKLGIPIITEMEFNEKFLQL